MYHKLIRVILLPILLTLLHFNFVFSQNVSNVKGTLAFEQNLLFNEHSPRIGKYSDSTGSYELLLKVVNYQLDPGEQLTIDVHIVGYGMIDMAKMGYTTSTDIFDDEKSKVFNGVDIINNEIYWPYDSSLFYSWGQSISLSGIKMNKWESFTLFFDIMFEENPDPETTPLIFTEFNPPVQFRLRLKQDARPGNYDFKIVFVYFNGVSWITKNFIINFTIRNIYDRYEFYVWLIGIIAALSALLPFLWKVITCFKNFFSKLKLNKLKSNES